MRALCAASLSGSRHSVPVPTTTTPPAESTERDSSTRFLDIASQKLNSWDINLTKDSNILLHAIYSSFYWRILKENHSLFWFSKSLQKIREKRKLKSIPEKHFVERKEN